MLQRCEDAAHTKQVPEVQQAPVGRTRQELEAVSAQVGIIHVQKLITKATV